MKKVLLCRSTIAVLVACSMFSTAHAARRSPAKCAKTIELKQADPQYMLEAIGVDAQGKPCSIVMADEGTSSSTPSLAPEGIDSVIANSPKSLYITGVPSAVDKLIGTISKLDVTPKTVHVKLESYIVAAKLADEISPTTSPRIVPTAAQVRAFLAKLHEAQNDPIVAPIISTIDRTRAQSTVFTSLNFSENPTETEPQYMVQAKATVLPRISNEHSTDATLIISFTGDIAGAEPNKDSHAFHNVHLTGQSFDLGDPYCVDRQEILGKTILTFATFRVVE